MSRQELERESDQAADLRRRVEMPHAGPRSQTRWIAVVTGRSGDGATRVARELSLALEQRGLSLGWLGNQTLKGSPDLSPRPLKSTSASTSASLSAASSRFDRVLIDLGTTRGEQAAALWQRAHKIVMVCRPEVESLTAVYGAAKHWMRVAGRAPISLVINAARSTEEASRFAERFDESCRRFLRQPNDYLGELPYEPHGTRLNYAVRAAAERLAESLEQRWLSADESQGNELASEALKLRAFACLTESPRSEFASARSLKTFEKSSIANARTTDRIGRVT